MNDRRRLPAPSATINLTASEGSTGAGALCVVCRSVLATTRRKTVASLGYWNPATEPVCQFCAADLDSLTDRCIHGVLGFDRAVWKFRGRLAA
jgi:hypothetical protein